MNTTALADTHAQAIAKKRSELVALDEELAELAEQETAIRMDWIRSNPSKRSDGVGTPVSAIRREIDQKARKRSLLAADIAAQERILVDLERDAESERDAEELRAAEAAIAAAEAESAEAYTVIAGHLKQAHDAWPRFVEAVTTLDALPSGDPPVNPVPRDFLAMVRRALTTPGDEPFAEAPRIVAHRIGTTGSGTGPVDTRGFAKTLSDLGDF